MARRRPQRSVGWRLRQEAGAAGGFEAIAFGLMIFVAGTLLVANVWAVIDTKFAAAAAAREAARAYVEADPAGDPVKDGVRAAEATMAAYGRAGGLEEARLERGAFRRCERATWVVTAQADVVALPGLGALADAYAVTARYSEIVDPLRSGLPGEATCIAPS